MVIETRKTHTGAAAASLVLDQKVVAHPLHPHLARTIADCLEGIQPSSIKAIEAVTGHHLRRNRASKENPARLEPA
jgi:hypothetical protein